MKIIKLVVWSNPIRGEMGEQLTKEGHRLYTIIGTMLTDEPLDEIPKPGEETLDDCCFVLEAGDPRSWEVVHALKHLPVRPAKQQGRDANSYLMELGLQ